MENIEAHGLKPGGTAVSMPIQLSLAWSDASEETAQDVRSLPASPESGLDAIKTQQEQKNDLIEAQARLTKTVCLTLFGIGLIALHFY